MQKSPNCGTRRSNARDVSDNTIVMLLSNALAPDPRVESEARGLIAAGFDVRVLCWDRDDAHPAYEDRAGLRIERIRVASTHGRGTAQILFLLLFWAQALRRVLRSRPRAIHCHDFDTLPLGWLGGRLLRVPVVYDAHESYPDMVSRSLPGPLVAFIRVWERWHLKRVDLVITVGDKLAERMREDGAGEVVVVGNWKDPGRFEFPPDRVRAIREELGIPPAALVVCFVANLGTDRKIEELLEASVGLEGVWLIIGGDGPAKESVLRQSRRNPNIRYLGFVEPCRIPEITAASDIVYYGFDDVNPNARYSAPNKLFEALAAGKALITGTFGEIGAIVAQHRLGVSLTEFSPATVRDAICSLRDDPEEFGRIQARSRALGRSSYNLAMAHHRLSLAYAKLSDEGSAPG